MVTSAITQNEGGNTYTIAAAREAESLFAAPQPFDFSTATFRDTGTGNTLGASTLTDAPLAGRGTSTASTGAAENSAASTALSALDFNLSQTTMGDAAAVIAKLFIPTPLDLAASGFTAGLKNVLEANKEQTAIAA